MANKEELLIAQRAYAKALKRAGYNADEAKERRKTLRTKKSSLELETPVYSRELYPSLTTPGVVGDKVEDVKYKAQVSSQYVLGQAYNKGNFQVLGRKETKDDATGKRH